ncbi:TRAP transporter small permease [Treponema socranskii]|uniref:TRAP transporter small permease n=1 Tax=Treponema socranskii TaxID=53419 RepID=UPI00068FB24A|nr:TRAP transporter small permease subunit [Treponema socranskii]MDR9860178.1 TRAP transporter small permease subunit [Treponema socranskii]
MKKKIIKFLRNIDYHIQPILMSALLITALIQVLYRFVHFIKTPWTLELITFLFSASVWFGISIAIKENIHVGIEVVYKLFPVKIRKILKIFNNLFFMIMMIFLGYLGTHALIGYFRSQTLAPATHLPYWFLRSPCVFGSILSVYRIIEKIHGILTGKDPELID